MSVYQNLMSQIDNSGLLFNVAECDLYTDYNQPSDGLMLNKESPVGNKKALINTANGKVMSVVSKGYKVVTNEEIFSGFCRSVEASRIDADGAQVNVRQTPDGARAMVDFVFPNQLLRVGHDESTTALQLCALNSFDGTTRYITKAGGLRMKCLNGQILGNIVGAYSSTHTSQLDVDAGAESVIRMIEQFNKASDYWGAMMKVSVGKETADKVFMKFLMIKELNPKYENSRLERCRQLWRQYSGEMGRNAYALYNVLTHYVSHQEKAYKNPCAAMMHQRSQLEKIQLKAEPFVQARKLELAA